MPALAASPYAATASATVSAGISKEIGSGPICVITCASPIKSIARS
ncbi:secreted protein [gut metagenome]|uniref:Secreted protein n=1 Tax=gut metagenome TaxID=749906 RepID=J9FE31_9ZZZZ